MPGSSDLCDDLISFGGPDERLGSLIVLLNVVHDCLNQLLDATERAASDAVVGDFAKPAFDQIQPGTAGGREMDVKSSMPFQPRLDLRMLVRCVVVHDQVQVQLRRSFGVDLLEELDPLLVTVLGHAGSDQPAFRHFDRGEQGRRAVAFIIVGHRAWATAMNRQPTLRSVQRLDRGFLVGAEH